MKGGRANPRFATSGERGSMYDRPRPLPSGPLNHDLARLLDEPQDEAEHGADDCCTNEDEDG